MYNGRVHDSPARPSSLPVTDAAALPAEVRHRRFRRVRRWYRRTPQREVVATLVGVFFVLVLVVAAVLFLLVD